MNKYTHGKHVMLDLQYDPIKTNLKTNVIMDYCNKFMFDAITENSNMKIIDRRLHLFDEPPGFTIFFCLDESHCSVHSYTNRGLLSFDCYTCGITDPNKIMEEIEFKLQKVISGLKATYFLTVKRFHYNE